MTNENAKFEIFKHFFLFFPLACERLFIQTHSIEGRCFTGPGNILFADASVHLSARTFLQVGAVKGLNKIVFVHRNHKLNKQVQETQK